MDEIKVAEKRRVSLWPKDNQGVEMPRKKRTTLFFSAKITKELENITSEQLEKKIENSKSLMGLLILFYKLPKDFKIISTTGSYTPDVIAKILNGIIWHAKPLSQLGFLTSALKLRHKVSTIVLSKEVAKCQSLTALLTLFQRLPEYVTVTSIDGKDQIIKVLQKIIESKEKGENNFTYRLQCLTAQFGLRQKVETLLDTVIQDENIVQNKNTILGN